jgi:neutral ceramidase
LDFLKPKLPASESAYYSADNILISATHTHAGPGGHADDFLYQITSLGIVKGEREAIAKGVAEAIYKAHMDLKVNGQGTDVKISWGDLLDASINRSKLSYVNNPADERSRYSSDVDTIMTAVSVKDKGTGKLRGVVNWFAVHGVSMNNTNEYVSGDNKGYASEMFELDETLKGNTGFVAAFGQSNAVSTTVSIP